MRLLPVSLSWRRDWGIKARRIFQKFLWNVISYFQRGGSSRLWHVILARRGIHIADATAVLCVSVWAWSLILNSGCGRLSPCQSEDWSFCRASMHKLISSVASCVRHVHVRCVHMLNYVMLGRFGWMEHLVCMYSNSQARDFSRQIHLTWCGPVASRRGDYGSGSRVSCCRFNAHEFALGVVT